MACTICGKEGGFECPTCEGDYCEKHFKLRVKKGKLYNVVDGICQRCGAEL